VEALPFGGLFGVRRSGALGTSDVLHDFEDLRDGARRETQELGLLHKAVGPDRLHQFVFTSVWGLDTGGPPYICRAGEFVEANNISLTQIAVGGCNLVQLLHESAVPQSKTKSVCQSNTLTTHIQPESRICTMRWGRFDNLPIFSEILPGKTCLSGFLSDLQGGLRELAGSEPIATRKVTRSGRICRTVFSIRLR
jgi:hypothetical protein